MKENYKNSDLSALKENTIKYLKDHRQCVIATSVDNQPFAAKVYCYLLEKYELVFSTFPNSNKYKNLIKNPNIAIEIDDGSPGNCMHYQGKAELVKSQADIKKIKTHILALDAPFRKFMERPDLQFFKIRPAAIYYTDYKKKLFHRDILLFDSDMNVTEVRNEKIF